MVTSYRSAMNKEGGVNTSGAATNSAAVFSGSSELGVAIRRRQPNTSIEPKMCGTSWGSVRWSRPISAQSVSYRSGRFGSSSSFEPHNTTKTTSSTSGRPTSPSPSTTRHRTSNFTTLTAGNSSSIADRYKRNSVLETTSSSARPEYVYLSSRNPVRSALIDIRQNLRPVRKDAEQKYTRPKLSALSSLSNALHESNTPMSPSYSPYSTVPNITNHSAAAKSAIIASSMAISNAMSQHRPIPKSERPWRQRLADAAQMREKNAENSGVSSYSLNSYTGGNESNFSRTPQHYGSSRKSSALVALQQRKLQETAEQNLQEQLAELRSIVAEEKTASRYSRRSGEEMSNTSSRRDSTTSAFSTASRSSVGAGSLASYTSALSSMPSAIRARQNATAATSSISSSMYAPASSNIHPPYFSAHMSQSYSPIKSSNVFQYPADMSNLRKYRDERSNDVKSTARKAAPLASMETSIISNKFDEEYGNERIRTNHTSAVPQRAAVAEKINAPALTAYVRAEPKKTSRAQKNDAPTKSNTTTVSKDGNERSSAAEAAQNEPLKKRVVKRILKITAKRKDSEEKKPTESKAQMVCEAANDGSEIAGDSKTQISKRNFLSEKERKIGDFAAQKTTNANPTRTNANSSSPTKATADVDDECRYNAIAQFKPASALRKKAFNTKADGTKSNNAAETASTAIAPVPGTWSSATGVQCISYNRHLKKQACLLSVEVRCKHFPCENVAHNLREASKALAKKIRRATIKTSNIIVPKFYGPDKETSATKEVAKPKKLTNALAVLNCEFSNKKRFRLGIQKTIRPYGLELERIHFKCAQSKFRHTALALNIVFREQSRHAVVKIFSTSANSARAHASFSVPCSKTQKKSIASAVDKENLVISAKPISQQKERNSKESDKKKVSRLANKPTDEILRDEKKEETLAKKDLIAKMDERLKADSKKDTKILSDFIERQRPSFIKNTHIPNIQQFQQQKQKEQQKGQQGIESEKTVASNLKEQVVPAVIPFVLPSESLLEEYVQQKRSDLERNASYALNSNAFNVNATLDVLSQSSASASRCDSPLSAASYTTFSVQIPVQNFIKSPRSNKLSNDAHPFPHQQKQQQLHIQQQQQNRLFPSTAAKEAGGRTPKITDSDLIENEKMIELLACSNSALPSGPLNIAAKVSLNVIKEQQTQQQKEQQALPLGHLFRNLKKPADVVKKVNIFDVPKSLFEEQMQHQAAQLKRTSTTAQQAASGAHTSFPVLYEESVDETDSRKRLPIDKQTVTQNFAAAIASQQPRHQHERYAAHIPLSGRQSTTSVDSSNSGALDSASCSIDQMIDQARHRHHQHQQHHHQHQHQNNHHHQQQPQQTQPQNGKFKEAIDYLDQIFEDLRKDCGVPVAVKNNKTAEERNAKSGAYANGRAALNGKANDTPNSKTLPKNPRRLETQEQQQYLFPNNNFGSWKKAVIKSDEQQQQSALLTKQQLQQQQENNGATQQRQQFVQKRQQQQKQQADNVDVTVLANGAPKKSGKENRLDFTRKWLVNDSKLWSDESPQQIGQLFDEKLKENRENSAGELNSLSDDSEHSIGSCSAEVAAINASEKQRQKTSGLGQTTTAAAADAIKTKTTTRNNKSYVVVNNKKLANGITKTTTTATAATNKKDATIEIGAAPKKKQHTVTVVEPIRPLPYRPQPFHATGLGASDYDLHKVSSTDKLNGVQFRSSSQNRASSQDHYSMGSTHSQEGIKPTTSFLSVNSLQRGSVTGAFVNYPQRGSIQSLPDAALMQNNNKNNSNNNYDNKYNNKAAENSQKKFAFYNDNNNKMIARTTKNTYAANSNANSNFATELELDSLVAELELNTYPEDNTCEHKRLFPTMQAEKYGGKPHPMQQSSAAKTAAPPVNNASASKTNSMRRTSRNVSSAPKTNAPTIGAIVGNAASIGTVIGQAAITAQQYKQQQKQRLHNQNSSVSPTRKMTTNADVQKTANETEEKQRKFHLRQKSGENAFAETEASGNDKATIAGLTPSTYHYAQSQQPQQQQQQQRKFSGGSNGSGSMEKASTSAGNPFETINQERFKPSRVEAIQHMFEKTGNTANNASTGKEGWPRKVLRQDSAKEEPLYCEISEYKKDNSKTFAPTINHSHSQRLSEKPKLRSVNIHPVFCQEDKRQNSIDETRNARFGGQQQNGFKQQQGKSSGKVAMPATFTNAQLPASAPPKRPPPLSAEKVQQQAVGSSGRVAVKLPTIVTTPAAITTMANGAADLPLTPNSSANRISLYGGRLFPASVGGSRVSSLNSTTADDEDDGFYDNIPADHHHSSSALSEAGDNASLSSQHLRPPSSGSASQHKNGSGRQFIGKLIRRIGGIAGAEQATSSDAQRPPTSAASLVSLNRVGSEKAPHSSVGLMKSNSLSYEPWRSQARSSTESVNAIHSDREDAEKVGGGGSGFGNRLKHSIFGSKKRIVA